MLWIDAFQWQTINTYLFIADIPETDGVKGQTNAKNEVSGAVSDQHVNNILVEDKEPGASTITKINSPAKGRILGHEGGWNITESDEEKN